MVIIFFFGLCVLSYYCVVIDIEFINVCVYSGVRFGFRLCWVKFLVRIELIWLMVLLSRLE